MEKHLIYVCVITDLDNDGLNDGPALLDPHEDLGIGKPNKRSVSCLLYFEQPSITLKLDGHSSKLSLLFLVFLVQVNKLCRVKEMSCVLYPGARVIFYVVFSMSSRIKLVFV